MARGSPLLQPKVLARAPEQRAIFTFADDGPQGAGTIRIGVAEQLSRIANRQREIAEAVPHANLRLRFLASADRLEAVASTAAHDAR